MLLKRLNLIQEEKIKIIIDEVMEVCNMNFALQRSLGKDTTKPNT
jgi:hypothetical protein